MLKLNFYILFWDFKKSFFYVINSKIALEKSTKIFHDIG